MNNVGSRTCVMFLIFMLVAEQVSEEVERALAKLCPSKIAGR